jgi:putative transposase
VIDDLNVAGMTRNRRLARHVAGVGMGQLRRQVEYKTGWSGVRLHIANRWYPSSKTCSGCGAVKTKLRLSERTFRCDECPLVLARDLNAARTLAALVGEVIEEVIGGTSSQSCVGDGQRARWKPAPDPHRVGSGYCHGKTHEVNAAPQGDGCPNRADLTSAHSSSGNGF